jgi:hypothetical protein
MSATSSLDQKTLGFYAKILKREMHGWSDPSLEDLNDDEYGSGTGRRRATTLLVLLK